MIDYTLTFKQDVYSITNTGTNPLTVDVKAVDNCTTIVTNISEIILAPLGVYVLPLVNDSLYSIELIDTVTDESIDFNIKYYQNLELSLIEDIFTVLCTCNCGCADCVDESKKPCEALLTAKARTEMYILLSSPRYTAYVAVAMQAALCYTTPSLYCSVTEEWVGGSSVYNEKLMKQLLALNYLGIYFQELSPLTLQADVDYLNQKFMTDSIFCCITKLGVDINAVKNLIDTLLGSMTVDTGSYFFAPPTTGNVVLTTLNRTVRNILISEFPYNDPAGTPISAIRIDSLLIGLPIGTLKWNGIDVIVGQVITATQFTQFPLLFTPPDIDDADSDIFSYSAKNGNGIWSTD